MPPEETAADAPDIGIGPANPETTQKEQTPPATFLAPPESTPAATLESSPEKPEKAGPSKPIDWTKVDFRRGKETDLPEEHREEFRRRQEDWKAYQSENSRREADLRRREQEIESRERRNEEHTKRLEAIETRLSSAPSTEATKDKIEQTQEQIDDLLAQPDLDPDVKDAIQMVDKRLDFKLKQINDKLKLLEDTLPKIETLTQAQQQEARTRQAQDRAEFVKQIQDARDLYGEDIDAYSDEIAERCGYQWDAKAGQWVRFRAARTNRATGEPHTVMSAYEHEAGITARKAAALREEDEKIRKKAKSGALPASTSSTPPATGDLTETDARAMARELGFGRR